MYRKGLQDKDILMRMREANVVHYIFSGTVSHV